MTNVCHANLLTRIFGKFLSESECVARGYIYAAAQQVIAAEAATATLLLGLCVKFYAASCRFPPR
jgi:hypothetical protein